MNPAERDAQVQKYLWLVHQIAGNLIKHLKNVDFNDLVGDGCFGLLRAIEQFDPNRGIKFETYATPVIRGAMLNGLRALDWMPERKRAKTRELQKIMEEFQQTHSREGTEVELAEKLQVSAQEVYELIADLGNSYLLSLDQPANPSGEDTRSMVETVEDKASLEPGVEVEFEEERELLKQAIENLPEREKHLVSLYYFEGKSFEEIAEALSVSKQRISQIHARAVKRLRDALNAGGPDEIGRRLDGSFLD